MTAFEAIIGQTLVSINIADDNESVTFITTSGQIYQMLHHSDCCESVELIDIDGDLPDLVGSPILVAEEVSNLEKAERLINPQRFEEHEACAESFTWTFYKFDTAKGGCTFRWFGESNGYYSEDVSFQLTNKNALDSH